MSKYVNKLVGTKYKRPETTFQQGLSHQEIADRLQGYKKVAHEELADLPLDTHLRYFTTGPDGTQQFRLGGFLKNKSNADTYLILSTGKANWSVQVRTAVFYRKLSQEEQLEEMKKSVESQLEQKNRDIETLKRYIMLKCNIKHVSLDSIKTEMDQAKARPRTIATIVSLPAPKKSLSKTTKKSSSKTTKKPSTSKKSSAKTSK